MGEFLSLLTAVLYSAGVIFYKRSVASVSPFAMNLFKNTVAMVLLALTAIALGKTALLSISPQHLLLMFASGAMGIGISDTLFLMTLARLGASRTALVDCLYSPFVILFSLLLFRETLTPLAAVGGSLILASVILSSQRSFGAAITGRQFAIGCGLGTAAMATVAFAIVMMKPVLDSYPLALVSAVRMAGGLAFVVLSLPLHPDRRAVFAAFRPQPAWRWMLLGTFFGSYLSIITWLAGFKYSQAGIAALLNQTSTVLIVVFAAVFLKEPMTRLKLVAVAMAFVGTVIILF